MSEDLVYVIGQPGHHVAKIGHSVSPKNRLQSIRTMSPLALSVLATYSGGQPLETMLHSHLRPYRIHGEWFDFRGLDPVTVVEEAIASLPKDSQFPPVMRPEPSRSPSVDAVEAAALPDCVCSHKHLKHGLDGCTLFDGPEEWDECQCVTYVSVDLFQGVPSASRTPLPRPDGIRNGPFGPGHKAIVEDRRHSYVLGEISKVVWPDGTRIAPGWWPEIMAENIVWRLQHTPNLDQHPSAVFYELIELRWRGGRGNPVIPGRIAEQLADRIVQNTR